MKARPVLLVLALLAPAIGPAAEAATRPRPKPVCQIIKDAPGDATYNNVPGDGNDDIVSGDLASDGRTVTGVLRLAALAQPDPAAPLGQAFFVRFSPRGSDKLLFLSARTFPSGTTYSFGYSADDPNTGINTSYTLGAAKGVVDSAKKEVRVTVPVTAFKAAGVSLVKGLKLLTPTAETYRIVGQGVVPSQEVGPARVPLGGVLLPFDEASGAAYVVGTPSCARPVT